MASTIAAPEVLRLDVEGQVEPCDAMKVDICSCGVALFAMTECGFPVNAYKGGEFLLKPGRTALYKTLRRLNGRARAGAEAVNRTDAG